MDAYSADQIDWLRPPEVEGERGDWTSRWLLTADIEPPEDVEVPDGLHPDILSAALTRLAGREVRLDLRTSTHPLDPEGYPAVDTVLLAVDASIGLALINGSKRDKWRPFR
jgi:hypothetical protein